jgi:hypothetical protein
MSTRSLLLWIALVSGAELGIRGHLSADASAFHGGLWLLVASFAALAWHARRARRRIAGPAAVLAVGLAVLSIVELASGAIAGETPGTPPPAAPAQASHHATIGGSLSFPDDAWAVVVLDEAGTERDDEWPGVLQSRFDRLACRQTPVVRRTTRVDRALATKPDLILTRWRCDDLDAALDTIPAAAIGEAPRIPPRASVLGRAAEAWLRRSRYEHRWRAALAVEPGSFVLRGTPCTSRYRGLVLAATRRGLPVALLTPSLAANERTAEATLRALEANQPDLRRRILVARLCELVIHATAGAFGAEVIDTTPGLDGEPKLFDDALHPNAAGLERLADNVIAALGDRPSDRNPGCHPVQ